MPDREPEGDSPDFAELVARDDLEVTLAEAALTLARDQYTSIRVTHYLEILRSYGDRVERCARSRSSPAKIISCINSVLFDDIGFHANTIQYYDPRNSFLNQVIDRHTGIPITLSIVYMEVARLVGLSIQGVGTPGHFLVRHVDESGPTFIDPYNQGRRMSAEGVQEMIAELSGGKLAPRPEHFESVTAKQILTRMMINLVKIYVEGADYSRALWAIDRILVINPASADFVRDRGMVLAAAGKQNEALDALQKYLAMLPDAPDTDLVLDRIREIKQRRATLN
ncbi:MAG TPA: transglutaminase-like domain-containing protein [Blastocatellia bacterium]|nr:transglutaminase-like domain-containing protein [Blastocatellia bacterium]